MIKPQDLRVGNLLEYNIGTEKEPDWQTTTIDWQDIKHCSESNEGFNQWHRPLDITTSFLAINGFTEDNEGRFWRQLQTHYLELIPMADGVYPIIAQLPELSSDTEQRVSLNRISAVHELQNLWHSLTGKELTSKSED